MKKFRFILLTVLLLLIFSACDNSDKKMRGFTYEEAAEYLASIENLEVVTDIYEIPCEETPIYVCKGKYAGANQAYVYLENIFSIKETGPSDFDNKNERYTPITAIMEEKNLYIGTRPQYAAYFLEAYGFKSSPDWTEWVQYYIPSQLSNKNETLYGQFASLWYNPLSASFEHVVYICEKENSTEVYIIYQEISMFNKFGYPYLISEELGNQMETEFEDIMKNKKLGNISEFSDWFTGEYLDDVPAVFSGIESNVYYGNSFYIPANITRKFLDSQYNDPTTYYNDMKKLGVNFDELRVYIIKATVPHDGTVQDIFWELIG